MSSTAHAPTAEQQNAIDLALTGRSLVIQAGAGTGKTSTLVMVAQAFLAFDASLRLQFIAFNRSIVTDARKKFPRNVACSTAHSLAYRAVCNADFEARQKNGKRMRSVDIANRLRVEALRVDNDGEQKLLSSTFLAGLALRAATRFCQSADPTPTGKHVPWTNALSHDANLAIRRHLDPIVKRAWADLSIPEGGLPFTTSTAMAVYLKLWQLSRPIIGADVILYDESQDASPVMVDVVALQADADFRAQHGRKPAQLIWVGDSQQQIYGFTGAINALETVPSDEEAFLTQSFRFGPAVAAVANHVLDQIPAARLRLVGFEKINSVVAAVAEPHAILTRTNATAVRNVLDCIASGRRPHLVGGGEDVIYFAESAASLMNGIRVDHPELACFEDWDEVQRYVDEDEQGGDLRLLVNLIDEFGAEEIVDALKNQPSEDDADLVVSTAHKSKGREWDTVQIADDFPEDRLAAGGDEAVDELRLLYVAVTRAKLELDVTRLGFLRDGVAPNPVAAPAAPVVRQERAPVKRSQHVGTVGQEITVTATCVSAKGMTTRFGWTHLTQLTDTDGNVFKAFMDEELEPGAVYEVTGRVKAHGEFKGVAETTINYVVAEAAVSAVDAPVGVEVLRAG